jgi:hypothetical protein
VRTTLSLAVGLLIVATGVARAQDRVPAAVAKIFADNCAGCHQGHWPASGLSWEETKIAAAVDRTSREVPSLKIIDTAAPEASYVLKKVRGERGIDGTRMPPGRALEAGEIKVLEAWILSLKKVPGPPPT